MGFVFSPHPPEHDVWQRRGFLTWRNSYACSLLILLTKLSNLCDLPPRELDEITALLDVLLSPSFVCVEPDSHAEVCCLFVGGGKRETGIRGCPALSPW